MFKPSEIPTAYRRFARGALIVELKDETQLGNSATMLPKGSIGFVQASRDKTSVVHFPWINHHGVVDQSSYKVIGRQPV